MALDSQIIQLLDSHTGDAKLGAGGNVPLQVDITDKAISSVLDITAKATKKREDEFAKWEKALADRITTMSKMDGVRDRDKEALMSKRNETIDFIQKNPDLLIRPQRDMKAASKMESDVNSYASKVDLSKQYNAFEKSIVELMKKPEYNNPVMRAKLEEFRNSPLESVQLFAPVADPSYDIKFSKSIDQTAGQAAKLDDVRISDRTSSDGSMVTTSTYYPIDENKYYNAFPNGVKEYYSSVWDVTPSLQTQKKEDYVKEMVMSTIPSGYKPEVSTKSSVAYNANIREQAAEARDVRRDTYKEKEEERKQIQKDADAVKKVMPIINPILSLRLPEYQTNRRVIKSGIMKNVGISEVAEVNSSKIPPDVSKVLYSGGKKEYGDAFGKLYYTKNDDGSERFYKAKEVYLVGNEEVDADTYKAAAKKGLESVSKQVRPDWDSPMSEEDILNQVMGSNAIYAEGYNAFLRTGGITTEAAAGGVTETPKINTTMRVKYDDGTEREVEANIPSLTVAERTWLLNGNKVDDSEMGKAIWEKIKAHYGKRTEEKKQTKKSSKPAKKVWLFDKNLNVIK